MTAQSTRSGNTAGGQRQPLQQDALLTGIRNANYHEGGIRCLQLFHVNETMLASVQADVDRLCRNETGSNVTDRDHITHWAGPQGEVIQFSLLNASGRYDDFRSDHDLSCLGKRFHSSDRYPELARLVELFPHTINFRINLLGPGARLSAHEEHVVIRTQYGSVALRARFHLPVFTNPEAEVVLDGEVYHFEAGTVYLFNNGCVHSARNGGARRRIHLVWDMLLTREAFAFMFEQPPSVGILERIPENAWNLKALRTERVGRYARVAPLVARPDAERIGWCEVQ